MRQEKWSLDACVGYARKHELFLPTEMVSTKTLYNEIWASNLVLQLLELSEALKRKKCCKSTAKRKKAYGATIDERPEITSSRLEVGHWESDTVVGKRKGKEAVILTLLEKKTQHYLAIRIPGKRPLVVFINPLFNQSLIEFFFHFNQHIDRHILKVVFRLPAPFFPGTRIVHTVRPAIGNSLFYRIDLIIHLKIR